MTAAEATADRGLVCTIAGAADVDPRTVVQALAGRRGKGSAYRRTMRELAAAGVDMATIPSVPPKAPKLAAVTGGKT